MCLIEDCTWSGNAAKDVSGGCLKITNTDSNGYSYIGSGNGFSKSLTGAGCHPALYQEFYR